MFCQITLRSAYCFLISQHNFQVIIKDVIVLLDIHLFIHPVYKYLLSACCILCQRQRARDLKIKQFISLSSWSLLVLVETDKKSTCK